ncbi:MAG: radical SAM protein [Candidatus Alcyoniella australis]|nr:radical SAM protein [Candidatus Alcyoniella australis]
MSDARAANRELSDRERGEGLEVYQSLPLQLQLEPTNRCNLNCQSCARHSYDCAMNRPIDFSPQLLERVRPLFATAEQVLLGGYGEPTLAPRLLEIAAAIKSVGAHLSMVTNGTLLSSKLCGSLAALPLDELLLSIDAARPETLKRLRGVSLELLQRNVDRLNKARGEGPPRLVLQCVLQRDNVEQLPELVGLAQRWRASGLRAVHQRIYQRGQQQRSLLLDPQAAAGPFDEARKLADDLGLELELPPLQGQADCVMPLEMLLVRAEGTVHGCCSAVFSGSPCTLELGSALQSDLHELYNAEPMRRFRAAFHGRGEFPEPCQDCAFRNADAQSHFRPLD